MSHEHNVVIIGAGPTAAAAAVALSKNGIVPEILDVGLRLEPEREAIRRRLALEVPEHWARADLDQVSFQPSTRENLAEKRHFGSPVTFEDDGVLALSFTDGVGIRPSLCYGGMSTIWGAGLLGHRPSDIADWPLGPEDLSAHYRAVLEVLPYAASHDHLEELFPLYREPDAPLEASSGAERVLARLEGHRSRLAARGLYLGRSRLAVRSGTPVPEQGCIYCGRCLDGCPYEHIYSASQTIDALVRAGRASYRASTHVVSVRETPGGVEVIALDRDGRRDTLRAARVLLGAGALSTTHILQCSGLLPDRVELLDSQTFYLPFGFVGRTLRPSQDHQHELAQLFLWLEADDDMAGSSHLSLYTPGPGLEQRARGLSPLGGRVLGAASHAIVVAIGFVHSDASHRLSLRLRGDGASEVGVVWNERTRAELRHITVRLLSTLGPAGLLPLLPLLRAAKPGGGYHVGGSIPMRAEPRFGECDTLGRPNGLERVHVIDASCFPSIPGGSITLPAMANAHRIASLLEGPPP